MASHFSDFAVDLLCDALTTEKRVEFSLSEIGHVDRPDGQGKTVTGWRVEIKTDTFVLHADAHSPFWTLTRALGNLDERLKSERMSQ